MMAFKMNDHRELFLTLLPHSPVPSLGGLRHHLQDLHTKALFCGEKNAVLVGMDR